MDGSATPSKKEACAIGGTGAMAPTNTAAAAAAAVVRLSTPPSAPSGNVEDAAPFVASLSPFSEVGS